VVGLDANLDPTDAPLGRWQGAVVLAWWREGCPDGLSVRAWQVGLPAWLLTAAALAFSSVDAWVVEWLPLALSGYLVAGLLLLAAESGVKLVPIRARGAVVVLAWAVAGAAAITATMTLAGIAGVRAFSVQPGVVVSGALFAVTWLAVGGRFANALRRDAQTRAGLLRQLARERALALESARLVDADRKRLVEQTAEVVSEQLHKATALAMDPEGAAAALQTVVDEVVRPLSRELERGDVQEQALVEAVHTMGAASPRPLSEFLPTLARPSMGLVLATVLRVLVCVFVVVAGAASLWPTPSGWVVLGLVALYSILASGLLTLAVERAQSSEGELTVAVAAAEWASSRLRQLAWSTRERLGQSIHGDVQARIVATALQIQLGEPGDVEAELKTLDAEIHASLTRHDIDTDWRSVWERILRVWEYSVEVVAIVDPAASSRLESDPVAAHAVVSVLREGVTNAVRHGGARRLEIELVLDRGDILRLVIADDGVKGLQQGPAGLGTRTMDAACLDWSLRAGDDGLTLVARFPTKGDLPDD